MCPSFRGSKVDLKTNLNIPDAVCRSWGNIYNRKNVAQFITVPDILQCAAKYYYQWHYDPTPSCKTLGHMEGRRHNMEAVKGIMNLADMVTKPYFVAELTGMGLKTPLYIISIPDFVDDVPSPNEIINVKTHSMDKRYISYVTKEQIGFGDAGLNLYSLNLPGFTVGPTSKPDHIVQDEDEYALYGSQFPAYISDWVELMANDQLSRTERITFGLDTGRILKIVIMARDGQFENKIESSAVIGLYDLFEEWLTQVVYAHSKAKTERKFNQKIFDELVGLQIAGVGLFKSYQCHDCVIRSMGLCKGMPPMRKHRLKDDTLDPTIVGIYRSQVMEDFVKYWNSKGMSLPIPPKFAEREEYVNDKAVKVGGKGRLTRTKWNETIDWTREVQLAFDLRYGKMIPNFKLEGLGMDEEMESTLKDLI